ncbi:MAG: hypothetical protein ACKV2T_01390 [Kofleriaceae bacterium]
MIGIFGGLIVALGLVVLVAGMLKPRRVAVRCDGTTCVVEKIALLRTTSIRVNDLRGAVAEEKRRGARYNVRLVVRGDTEIEIAPWTSRGDSSAYVYREIAAKLEAHVANGSKGVVEGSVTVSRVIVLWMVAATLLFLGSLVVAIYLTGSKLEIDGDRGTFRHGKKVRGSLSEIASVEVRRGSIIATRKNTGVEARLLHTILGKRKPPPPELYAAADRIRAYLG